MNALAVCDERRRLAATSTPGPTLCTYDSKLYILDDAITVSLW